MIGRVNENLEILELVGTISESDEHDWTKALIRCKWYGKDPVFDIRNINFNNNRVSKGITLTEDEITNLAHLLVEKDFMSVDELERNVTRMKKRFDFEVPEPEKEMITLDFTD